MRKAYYPGAEQRWKELVESHPKVKRIGEATPGTLPWAIIEDIDSGATTRCSRWSRGARSSARRPSASSDPIAFLDEAVKFVQRQGVGHAVGDDHRAPVDDEGSEVRRGARPRDPGAALRHGVHQPLAGARLRLRHDAVGRPSVGDAGGHPERHAAGCTTRTCSRTSRSASSAGRSWSSPSRPGSPTTRRRREIGRRLVKLEAQPSCFKLPGIIMAALRG